MLKRLVKSMSKEAKATSPKAYAIAKRKSRR